MSREFDIIREDLHRRYGQALTEQEINHVLDTIIDEQKATARLTTFMPVLVERSAAEQLEELVGKRGEKPAPRKELLFVDERNAGRSQLAAAIARHLSGDRVFVRSVGIDPKGGIYDTVYKVLEEKGMRSDFLYQKEITPRVSHRADVVVLLGVDEVPGVPGDRYISWDIADPEDAPLEDVREIADDLEAHIAALLKEMEVPVSEEVTTGA